MQQLSHRLKDGHMEVTEVPVPSPSRAEVLVRNHYSVISAGTEGRTASDARKGYIAKARSRKEEVEKIIRMVRQQGWKSTYGMVMRRLEAPSPLGYSCAGEVIAVGDAVKNFKPGDRVACAGNSANHAEIVSVPEMLCAGVPDVVPFEDASFATIGAIAFQGVRQAGLQPGETAAVIGLGMLGMLTVQILNASGVRVMVTDVNPSLLEKAGECGAGLCLAREEDGLEESALQFSNGLGMDAVIITASTDSTDPVDLAGSLARKKGRVVVVGNVATGFNRKNYYRKELDLRMSMSYGPGRYDTEYEVHGRDYPAGYVRWTENRNMQAFLAMVEAGSVRPSILVEKVFPFDESPAAFDYLLKGPQNGTALLLQYDTGRIPASRIDRTLAAPAEGKGRVSVIGTGSYANNVLLPLLKGAALRGVVSAKGLSARAAMDKFGFAVAGGDADDIFTDESTDAVFILTRHDSHAALTARALKAGKHVFVEKPLALTAEELGEVGSAFEGSDCLLAVGFNRRFAPSVRAVTDRLPKGVPRAIHIRVNAAKLPEGHWAADPELGGGRILGEMCHFIDLARFLAGHEALRVNASGMGGHGKDDDTLTAGIEYADGSMATISYFSNGNPSVPKEEVEIFCGGVIAHIHDFSSWRVVGKKQVSRKAKSTDKGHKDLVDSFLRAVREGGSAPIPFHELVEVTRTTFAVRTALRGQRTIHLKDFLTSPGSSDQTPADGEASAQ